MVEKIFEKMSQCRKKTERVDFFGIFQHPFCCKTQKKLNGDTLAENLFSKKAEKNSKVGPFSLAR